MLPQVRQLVTERNSMGIRSRSESDLSKRSSQDRASGQGSGGLELDPEQVRHAYVTASPEQAGACGCMSCGAGL